MNSRYVRQIQGLAVLVVLLAASATALHAQTYTVLHTFPIGSGNDSGTGFPQVISQGRDAEPYSTIANDGTNLNGTAGTEPSSKSLPPAFLRCSTAFVPTGAKTGKIQVTTPGGTATSATNFTVT